MPKFPSKTQKKEMQTFMTKTFYEGCYARLHTFLQKKYTKKKASDLITWAVENELDNLTFDKNIFLNKTK